MPNFLTCGPNEAIIVSGCCRSTPTIRAGGRVFVWPFFHKVQRISLNTMTLIIDSSKVYSDNGVPITVKGIAQVKIQGKNLDYLKSASEMFLDMTSKEIGDIALATIDGHQRSMIASMKIEDIYKNRQEFSKNVHQNAQSDLIEMGLTLVSYSIQEISDDDGYLQALGQERIVAVQTDAKKEEAKQNKMSSLKSIESEQLQKERETEDKQSLALRQLELDIRRAELKKKTRETDARRHLMGQLQSAETNKTIVEETMKVRLMEKEKETDLILKQKELKELELKQTIENKADFECKRETDLAAAHRTKAIIEADMEADKIRRLADARAKVIKMQKEADAEVLREQAAAFSQYGDAAKLEMVLAILPRLAAEVAGPISECKKITSVSQDDGSVGFSRVTDEILGIVERLCQSVSTMTSQSVTTTGGGGGGPVSPTASVASSFIEQPRSRFGSYRAGGR